MHQGRTHTIQKSEDGFVLNLPLPFATREEVSVIRSDDELTLQAGNWRRNLVLPRALWGLDIGKAKFVDGELNIYFQEPEQGSQQA